MASEILPPPASAALLIGVDTHQDSHVAVALDARGALIASSAIPTTTGGYQQLLEWALAHATTPCGGSAKPADLLFGLEGSGSYGAGLCRHLLAAGCRVREVNRPNRQLRRQRGKDDTIDAEMAARSLLAGTATAEPKAADGPVEMLRLLKSTRDSAVQSRTRAINQLKGLLITAPQALREQLAGLARRELVQRCSQFRITTVQTPLAAARLALRSLARRIQQLSGEIEALTGQLDAITSAVAPQLKAAKGIGGDNAAALLIAAGDNPQRLRSEAAFASLCGVAPRPASSGKTQRYRLNRGGNRQANSALYRIALIRLRWDPATRSYVERRTAEGKSKREIIRCLKRFIAREVYRLLLPINTPPAASDQLPQHAP